MIVVQAKILLQELWSRGYEWDEPVTDELANLIGNWFNRLSSLTNVRVPRSLREPKPVASTEVMTFVDASKEAYGAVAYLRDSYEDNLVPRLLPSHAPKLRKDPGWGWSRDTPDSGVFSISVLKTLREEWQGNYCRCCHLTKKERHA